MFCPGEVSAFAPATNVPFRLVTHGSITAFLGWLVFSLRFAIYVEKFRSFNAPYGTVADFAVLLLYMYFSSLIMLIGAEINDIIDRQLQSRPSAADVA